MEGSDGVQRPPAATRGAPEAFTGEVVTCATCGLLAPVLVPPTGYVLPEARCAQGHFMVLTPAVSECLERLRGATFS